MSNKLFLRVTFLVTTFLFTQVTDAQLLVNNTGQKQSVHQVGLQLNPYLDESLFRGFMTEVIFGIRYAYHVTPHLSIGPEINGFTPIYFDSFNKWNHYRLGAGAFARYSFFTESRVRVFAEVLPFYSYRYREENQWTSELKDSRFGVCLSPGLSLYSKSRKFSVDLYMKFSNIEFVNKKVEFSYKVNYHF